MILEYSKDNIDIMHLEGAVFQSVEKADGVTSISMVDGGVKINGYNIPITDNGDVFVVDLSQLPYSDKISEYMSNIWGGGRMFPNVYSEDMPLDSIEPRNVDRFVPSDVEDFYDVYEDWINMAVEESLEEGVETGFMQDSMDNILGLSYGTINSVTWPTSIVERHGMRFHTHPEITFLADPSVADLELLQKSRGSVCADAIISTFGTDEIFTISYTVKIEDEDVNPQDEVDKYIENMVEMGIEELSIGKKLSEEDKIDKEPNAFDKGGIENLARGRIDQPEKRDMIRQIASDGYRIEVTWGVIE
jgi:hypothetical protein